MWNNQRQGLIVVLSGPSGSGKSSLARLLSEREPRLRLVVSATTRPPRETERDGIDYHFLSEDAFDEFVASGGFIEHALYDGDRYGTVRSEVEQAVAENLDLLMEIDVQGAAQVLQRYPEAVSIWILPPSWEALEARLRGRQTESEERIQARLQRAREECQSVGQYRYIVFNEDGKIADAVERIRCILDAERCRYNRVALKAIQEEFGGMMHA